MEALAIILNWKLFTHQQHKCRASSQDMATTRRHMYEDDEDDHDDVSRAEEHVRRLVPTESKRAE